MPQTEWLEQQKFTLHSSEGGKSKIKVLPELVSSEAFILGLQMASVSLCPHMALFLCMDIPGVLPFFIRTPVLLY